MKLFFVALVAAVGLAALCEARISLEDREGFFYQHRKRLGHFNEKPLIDLYKHYAVSFVLPVHPERSHDDFRNYMPSAEDCMLFFEQFVDNTYNVDTLEEFVKLDACLGYLYESKYHEQDKEFSEFVNANLDSYIGDQTLKNMYEGTKIADMPEQAKRCLGDLLYESILAKKQYSDQTCNNHQIQLLLNFADCQATVPELMARRNRDSYLRAIFDLVHKRGNECFNHEIFLINRATRQLYGKHLVHRIEGKLQPWYNIKKQSHERIWPPAVKNLLSAVEDSGKQINLREINSIIRGVLTDDAAYGDKILTHMAKYANKNANLKSSKANAADPNGKRRYQTLVSELCAFVRPTDNERYYDFFTAFYRMIRMLKYENIFGITYDYFLQHVLREGFETTPLYLSVCSCNLISFTDAYLTGPQSNAPREYKVVWKKDRSQMIQWPDAGYH